ncbi:hypothetical protein F5887DRAFT_1079492 [Amanita rubescens]|nr:hypothetical protein F5887DRAFT_1079492 [Amanita rubescens]
MGEAREAAGTQAGPEVGTMPAPNATKTRVWTYPMLQVLEEFGLDPAECEDSDTSSGVTATEGSEIVTTPADSTKGAPAATYPQPDVPARVLRDLLPKLS